MIKSGGGGYFGLEQRAVTLQNAVSPQCASLWGQLVHVRTIEHEDISWFGISGAAHDCHVACLNPVRFPDHWLISADHIWICNMFQILIRTWCRGLYAVLTVICSAILLQQAFSVADFQPVSCVS